MDLNTDISPENNVVLISVISEKFENHQDAIETDRSLTELQELMRTLGANTVGSYIQNRKKLDPATILGSGKLEEIALEIRNMNVKFVVFDFELTASQMRNISEIMKIDVLDRCQIILQIFAKHARTKEAKIQIEISRLNYLLPRLSSLWTHFTRQKGGIGLKGEGEQQLELDRRIIRRKIETYRKQLKEVKIARKEQKKRRVRTGISAALVGYTNAGKSSLMNRLCEQDVLEENKLFATLDSTFRSLTPESKPPLLLIDTVGFLSNLPNTLIEGFKTTLESIEEAELLIVVVDLSDPNLQNQIETTEQVLNELDLNNKEKIFVFNKKDKVENLLKVKVKTHKYKNSFIVSSYDKQDVKDLREYIIDFFLSKQDLFDLFVPYELGDIHSKIQKFTNILSTKNYEKGIYYRVRTPDTLFQRLDITNFLLSPQDKEILLANKIY